MIITTNTNTADKAKVSVVEARPRDMGDQTAGAFQKNAFQNDAFQVERF